MTTGSPALGEQTVGGVSPHACPSFEAVNVVAPCSAANSHPPEIIPLSPSPPSTHPRVLPRITLSFNTPSQNKSPPPETLSRLSADRVCRSTSDPSRRSPDLTFERAMPPNRGGLNLCEYAIFSSSFELRSPCLGGRNSRGDGRGRAEENNGTASSQLPSLASAGARAGTEAQVLGAQI